MTTAPFAGFTPAPECIREELGIVAANVFGAVWRFSMQSRGQCDATLKKISERAGYGTTVTRQKLRMLSADGWITEERRVGRPTVYRDAGRWVLQVVGEDTRTPTPAVAPRRKPQRQPLPPQREALATPTAAVALPQREALAEDSLLKKAFKKEPKRVAATTEPAAQSGATAPEPPPPVDAWLDVKARISEMFGGLSVTDKSGTVKPHVGSTIGLLGKAAGDDPVRALALLNEYASSPDRRFCNAMYRLPESVGSWLGKRGTTFTGRSVSAVSTYGSNPDDPSGLKAYLARQKAGGKS